MPEEERKLRDLVSVGPAMLEDFALLGITSVSQLRRRSPQRMYRELCGLRGQRIDPCCLDVLPPQWPKPRTRDCLRNNANGGIGVRSERLVISDDSAPDA